MYIYIQTVYIYHKGEMGNSPCNVTVFAIVVEKQNEYWFAI